LRSISLQTNAHTLAGKRRQSNAEQPLRMLQ